MALTANAILTMDEAHEELRESSNKYDSVIERRINGLSDVFDSRTGWTIAQQTLTGYRIDGNNRGSQSGGAFPAYGDGLSGGKYYVLIPIVPVQSVTQITINYDWDDTLYKTITDTTLFILKGKDKYGHSLSGRLQLIQDIFLAGHGNVLLNMVVGFSSAHPKLAEAKRLMIMQLQYEYQRWQNKETGIVSRTLPDGNISFAPPRHLLKEVEDGLADLKSWRFV